MDALLHLNLYYDVALVDINLPDGNAEKFCCKIKRKKGLEL